MGSSATRTTPGVTTSTTKRPERVAKRGSKSRTAWIHVGVPVALSALFWILDAVVVSSTREPGEFTSSLLTPALPHLALRLAVAGGLLAYGRLTRRKPAKTGIPGKRLHETQALLRAVVHEMPVMLFAYDEDRVVLFWNRECEAVTGYGADEIVGNRDTLERFYPDPAYREHLDRAWRDENFRGAQWVLTCKDGSKKTISWTSMTHRVPLPDWPNWSMGVDVSSLVSAEEELDTYRNHLESVVRQRTRELQESRDQLRLNERLASVGTLAAGIAHEINNPIGAILNSAEFAILCREDEDAQETSQKALGEIVHLAKRCGMIVKGLLQFSRGEPATKWKEDVNEIVRVAAVLTRSYGAERGVKIELELCNSPTPVLMNPIEMEQVLVNLLRNAIEAHPKDGRVLVKSEDLPDSIRIVVMDQGEGIDADQLEHIFDPFYTTRRSDGGTGLGLSVAHGIIHEHGGRVDVESRLGLGSQVTIELTHAGAGEEEEEQQAREAQGD